MYAHKRAEADATGYHRPPNVALAPTWKVFPDCFGKQHQYPCLLAEAMCDVGAGRELIWDYGVEYWGTLKKLKEQEDDQAPGHPLDRPVSSQRATSYQDPLHSRPF